MRTSWVNLSAFVLVAALATGTAKGDFANSSFSTGDLTGWTIFTTTNGTNGAGLPVVTSFNTTGSGASNSAEFNVGELSGVGTPAGGGLEQVLTLGPGSYMIAAAIASQGDADGQVNSAAGLFQVLVDGTSEGSNNLGGFSSPNQTLRGTLTANFTVSAAAPYTFAFEIARPFDSDGSSTPTEYITDIHITGTTLTPEPSTMFPLTALLGALAFMIWRRNRSSASRHS
jgi:hypothetical protein